MKKKVLFISVIIMLMISLVVLAGCANENNNQDEGTSTQENISNESKETYSINKTTEGIQVVNSKDEVLFTTNDYEDLKVCSNNKIILAFKDRHYIYLDLKGNRITDVDYWGMNNTISGTDFVNGNVIVEDIQNSLMGLMNENGEEIIKCQYKYMRYDEDEKLYLVDTNNTFPKDGSAYYINDKNEKIKDW